MKFRLCSILALLLCCTSCSCYDRVEFTEVTFPTDPPPWPLIEGVFIVLEKGYDNDLVEIYVDKEQVLSERVSTFSVLDVAEFVEIEDGDSPMDVRIHLPEHQRKYRFKFDLIKGPCVGASWDGEQLKVKHYNICPLYD